MANRSTRTGSASDLPHAGIDSAGDGPSNGAAAWPKNPWALARAAPGLEHLLIFLATGMAFGFAYSRRPGLLTIALPTFADAIELAQNWVPVAMPG
jgi:hypothetical protein